MNVQTEEFNLRDFLLKFDYTQDCEVRFIPKDKPLGTTTAYLTIAEMAQLSSTVNDAGVILMTYYFRKVKTPKFDFFDDAAVAKALGWTSRKTTATRQLLVKAGWLKKIVYTQPTTKAKFTVFYIGKEMCSKVLTPEEYTAQLKQKEAMDAQRDTIAKKLGYSDWEEVVANEDPSKILETFRAITLKVEAK